jgi:hypothetical protein
MNTMELFYLNIEWPSTISLIQIGLGAGIFILVLYTQS